MTADHGSVGADGVLCRPVAATHAALRQLAYADPQAFPVLLDSAATGPSGRYSILAAYPQSSLWQDGAGRVHATGLEGPHSGGFLRHLATAWRDLASRDAVPAGQSLRAPCGPFRGGWVVFLGYELACEVEPQLRLVAPLPAQADAPAAFALRIPAALVYDHEAHQAWALAEAGSAELLDALDAALAGLSRGSRQQAVGSSALLPALSLEEEPPGQFRARVEAALDYIRAGEIYQANLSRPWRGQFEVRAAGLQAVTAALYERLRAVNPAPFAALAQFQGWRLLCSSPERLVRVSAGHVDTRPIAGTRPRSRVAGQDESELAAMIGHPKERAEHVMLVDLERNDLGRICQPGSVRVDEFMRTESYAHVHHIVSNVCGELRPQLTPIDVLRAVFPGGTITGCPKFRCMQIIAELEGEARGAYTGSLGFINRDGSMDSNILIRSLTLHAGRLEFRTGAGIVADSDWRRELDETRAKARGLLAALT